MGSLTENQTAILTVFKLVGPMLDESLIAYYNRVRVPYKLPRQSDSGIRSRRSELAKMEPPKLVEVGKAKMSTGRVGRVWNLA